MSHDGELDMIRSLLRAEGTRDASEISEAHENVLNALGSHRRLSVDTPVSRLLRHQKQMHPVVLDEGVSSRECAKMLCKNRQSAALVVRTEPDGSLVLSGICSEVDICRRLVGQNLNADETPVSEIMTRNPQCVEPDEDANLVLRLMVKHKFRHLPVVEKGGTKQPGGIVGLIDITQCLYDAIYKIERLKANQQSFFSAVQRAQYTSSIDPNSTESQELAQRTLQALLDSISPPVGTVLQSCSMIKQYTSNSIFEAAVAMSEAKMTAVVVFNDGSSLVSKDEFVGILTSKDVMSRVVQKGLDPSTTTCGSCMTPNPDSVRKDSSVLDALHIMQTERYLHLPVIDCNGNAQEVCGILNVLDCAVHTFSSSAGSHVLSGSLQQQPYYPTPMYRSESEAIDSLYPPERVWRDPDSVSAFSEVRASSHMDDKKPMVESMVLKVKDMCNGKVFRISNNSISNLDDLIHNLEKATKRNLENVQLVYLDEDKDEVQLANGHALEEARQLAIEQHWKKIDIRILSSNEPSPSRLYLIQDPVLLVVIATSSLLLILSAMTFYATSDSRSPNYRRYR